MLREMPQGVDVPQRKCVRTVQVEGARRFRQVGHRDGGQRVTRQRVTVDLDADGHSVLRAARDGEVVRVSAKTPSADLRLEAQPSKQQLSCACGRRRHQEIDVTHRPQCGGWIDRPRERGTFQNDRVDRGPSERLEDLRQNNGPFPVPQPMAQHEGVELLHCCLGSCVAMRSEAEVSERGQSVGFSVRRQGRAADGVDRGCVECRLTIRRPRTPPRAAVWSRWTAGTTRVLQANGPAQPRYPAGVPGQSGLAFAGFLNSNCAEPGTASSHTRSALESRGSEGLLRAVL